MSKVIVLILLFAVLCADLNAEPKSSLPLVVINQAAKQNVSKEISLTGTITSLQVSNLAPQINGQVEKIFVIEGDYVDKDQIILEIDKELASLAFNAAQSATQQARAEFNDAVRRYEDASELLKTAVISTNEYNNLKAEVEIDKAFLQRQSEEEKRQHALLKRYTIKAPFAGVISEKVTEVGEWVSPENTIFTLFATDNLRAEFRVPQEFYPYITSNTELTITLDANPYQSIKEKISAVIPVTDRNARTFEVHAAITSKNVKLIPGMSAKGIIQLGANQEAIVISRDAIIRHQDGTIRAWVVKNNGQHDIVTERLIEIDHSFDNFVSIRDGIKEGELIVVRGNETLYEGQAVRIQETDSNINKK